ncbi:hypothetical protein EDM57_20615 [Brevibacillus gelatini]|uniref:Uncharacterized protein n=1 Tax=Brevibacillus gelatini TaxID=1655277 RepID=A0A3M8AP55_9BACL|nr:hypothetical protein [Brevibacillus gelatini]RNB52863.1 hypothetical protein EDM57_20615 [Brevibacillus gelatini]
MSDAFQIGPFLLKMSTLAVIVSIASGFLAITFLFPKERAKRVAITELLSNAVVLAFFVWKLSYALFHLEQVLQNPSSILYFSGGENGAWLAAVAVAVYLVVTVRKKALPIQLVAWALATGFLAAAGVHHLLTALLEKGGVWYHGQQLMLCLLFIVWLQRMREALSELTAWLAPLMWYAIGQVYVLFYFEPRQAVLLGLSAEQLVCYGCALLLLFLSRRANQVKGEGLDET